MIPRKIHYCWFGNSPLPSDVKRCMKTWRKFCPDYEIMRWDESNFDVNSHPFMRQAYVCKKWAFVSDYARLKIIYENGGIYLDTDVELIKPLDDLMGYTAFFGCQAEPHNVATGLGFGAVKHAEIVQKMMDIYEEVNFDFVNPEKCACPPLNMIAFRNLGYEYSDKIQVIDGIAIFPARYFDPLNSREFNLCDETISIHHYSATWSDPYQRFKRRFAWIIRPKIETFIKRMYKENL